MTVALGRRERATPNKSSRVAHPGFGRFATLHILAMAPPCLWLMRASTLRPTRTWAHAIAGLIQPELSRPIPEQLRCAR